MSTTPGLSLFTITTTASMASTTTTTSTTSSSISSAGGSGHGSIPAVFPLGAAHAVAPIDSQWLEYRVQFACDDLRARAPNISAQLDEEDDNHELTKRIILNEMQALLIECEEYNTQFNMYCAGIERARQDTFLKNIGNYRRALRHFIVMAGGNTVHAPTPGYSTHTTPILHTPKLAKVEALKLPRFNGESSLYSSFKANFDSLIKATHTPPEMWGHYLYLHLDEEPQAYVGKRENWQGKYTELWGILDSRYANRWTIAAQTIKSSFMSTPPDGDLKQINQYIDEKMDCIRSLSHLNLTAEQLAINVLLLQLPEDFANSIRNGLKIKRHDKGSLDYRFTVEEFRDVLNDTRVTWETESQTSTQKIALRHTPLGQTGRGSTPPNSPPNSPP